MRIAVISPVVPDPHAPYAGTQLMHRRVSDLIDSGQDVVVLAPDRPKNQDIENCPAPIQLFPAHGWSAKALRSGAGAVLEWLRTGVSLGPGARCGFAHSDAVHVQLAACDAVELHFTETLTLAPIIRKRFPYMVIAAVEHDVFLQATVRQLLAGGPGERVKAILRLPGLVVGERRLLRMCDVIAVLKPEDSRLLKMLGIGVPISVLAPAVVTPDQTLSAPDPVVLFVAAFDRPPNVAGARWLLDKVWPRVLATVPSARLRLVGGNPPTWLASRASSSVEVVGYLRDLQPEYQQAAVAVAPLLSGAGLKMKVPQALAYGLPVVATPIGAEGVTRSDDAPFIRVAADPKAFAAELTELLSDQSLRQSLGHAAREFAVRRFDFETSAQAFTDQIAAAVDSHRGVSQSQCHTGGGDPNRDTQTGDG